MTRIIKMEEWKIISDFQKYEVSNYGNVRSIKTKNILKTKLQNGYLCISLSDTENKIKRKSNHRLVALTFLENHSNKATVNHKDGNKLNNNLDNLELMTQKENVHHSINSGLSKIRVCPISQYDLNGNMLKQFPSIKNIEDLYSYDRSLIIRVCKGIGKTAYGFKWEYTNDIKPIESKDVEGNTYQDFGNYLITRDGKVYSKKSRKFLKPVINKNGHLYVTFCKDGKKQNFYVHVLVAKIYLSNPNNYSIVFHIDNDKTNNNLKNLKWVKYYNQSSS